MNNIQDTFYKIYLKQFVRLVLDSEKPFHSEIVKLIAYDKYMVLVDLAGRYYLINKNFIISLSPEELDEKSFEPKPKNITIKSKKVFNKP